MRQILDSPTFLPSYLSFYKINQNTNSLASFERDNPTTHHRLIVETLYIVLGLRRTRGLGGNGKEIETTHMVPSIW